MRALVLNASFEPITIVKHRRALVLLLDDKAELVEAGRGVIRSEHCTMPLPAVIRLRRYHKVPYHSSKPSRQGVLNREGHTCGYCGGRAETIDHIVPRSRGGRHIWENVVAACTGCNASKGDRLLAEIGWSLRVIPYRPVGLAARLLGERGGTEPEWAQYLGAAAIVA
ncbi:MAG TPA: HNH endonuclease [Acidimicrobiales bacterium]|nr:HNH endonuclease [Acidimicrobiales bacterium]